MKTYRRPKETPAIPIGQIKLDTKAVPQVETGDYVTMTAAARALGVHRDTLKRWIKEGKVPDVPRNAKNAYRMFSQDDIEKIRKLMNREGTVQRNGRA